MATASNSNKGGPVTELAKGKTSLKQDDDSPTESWSDICLQFRLTQSSHRNLLYHAVYSRISQNVIQSFVRRIQVMPNQAIPLSLDNKGMAWALKPIVFCTWISGVAFNFDPLSYYLTHWLLTGGGVSNCSSASCLMTWASVSMRCWKPFLIGSSAWQTTLFNRNLNVVPVNGWRNVMNDLHVFLLQLMNSGLMSLVILLQLRN